MKKNRLSIPVFITLTLFFIQGFTEPANLGRLHNRVISYHDSGQYLQDISKIIKDAEAYIINRVSKNEETGHQEKLAVILDIDETSLSNYDFMVKRGFVHNVAQENAEVSAAQSSPIQPTLTFYQKLLKHHVAVFFVTGRKEALRAATIKNLKAAGFQKWGGLYLAPDDYHQVSYAPFKAQTRAAIMKQGYTIIASLGDQLSDLKGGYAEKTFKLPNPYYFIP